MAYIVSCTTQIAAPGTPNTVTFPDHAVGDLLLLFATNDGGGTAIDINSGTGWAMLGGTGAQAASAGARSAWAYKVATGTTSEDPSIKGASDDWLFTKYVIRDVAANPFGSSPASGTDYVRTDYDLTSVKGRATSGSLTTAADDCLVLYGWGLDAAGTAGSYLRVSPDEAFTDSSLNNAASSTSIAHWTGHVQMGAAGSAPTVYCYSNLQDGGNGWVIAIRNSVGGKLQKDVRAGCTPIKWYGNFGTTLETLTYNVANNLTTDTINGISPSSTACTLSHTTGDAANPPGTLTAITTNENTAASWQGIAHDITSTNMTGKVFSLQWYASSIASPVGAEGWIVVFSDGTNWVAYRLGYPDLGIVADAMQRAVIALGAATTYAVSTNPINWGAITKIGYFQHRVGSSGTTRVFGIKNALLWDTTSIIGGNALYPTTVSYLGDSCIAAGIEGIQTLQGSGQQLGKSKLRIGDGATPTYFDLAAQSFEYPQAYSASDIRKQWNANASSVGVTIKASADDFIYCSAGVFATSTSQPFTIDASSSLSATYSFSGTSFVGWTVTDNAGVPWVGATFKSGGTFTTAGGDLTNCSISKTTSTNAALAVTANGSVIGSTSITVADTTVSTNYHLELGTAVTAITLADVTFSGTPATDKVHVLKTSGTVTITISGSTSLSAGDVTTAGATVVINAPAIYQEVQITNLVTGSRVQIYDLTNHTELANGIASGTTVTWTDGTAYVADRNIRVRISYVSGTTAKTFIEAEIGTVGDGTPNASTLTYRANQVADSVYNDNAVNGSAVTGVTFTDSYVDVMNIDVAANSIGWPSIYAAWVYYAFSETGIATDIDYIKAVDTANYLLSNLVIKNTSSPSEPLEITGGYGRDSTTLAAIDLVDTSGGTIVMAPDHVVSYAVGSGVTSQDKVDIAAEVLSQASSAPIHANVQKVNDITITGAGVPPTYDSEGTLTDPGNPFGV